MGCSLRSFQRFYPLERSRHFLPAEVVKQHQALSETAREPTVARAVDLRNGRRRSRVETVNRNRYEWIAPEVTLAPSALATITILEHEGYALMPL